MAIANKVQLITYPDSLGGDLKALHRMLETSLSHLFKGGVHILPPFPSSGDRGFAPLTYLEIDPSFGTWEDMRAIGANYAVLVDLMVNHVSRQSEYFRDFLEKGRASEHAGLFLTLDKVWPDGRPVQSDIDAMFLRRPRPYSTYPIAGTDREESVWTTFGKTDPSEQIDLDVRSEAARRLLASFFEHFKANNVKIVRLDAVGYVIKKPGTSCFFVEPDIYEFLDWTMETARSMEIELLPEVHSHPSIQNKLAERGFWIYDFILPYRILEALLTRDGRELGRYLKVRPSKQFTMLDCHDGIPVKPDLDGLLDTNVARRVVDLCVSRGANLSLILSDEHKAADGFDVHQIRGSYYSLLGGDDNAYLTARAVQFFAPGIPQVYYVGLLAGENDMERAASTGDGREINRHNYSAEEIERSLGKDVVQRLFKLIRFRNEYAAFDGEFEVAEASDASLVLRWTNGDRVCELNVDWRTSLSWISYTEFDGKRAEYWI